MIIGEVDLLNARPAAEEHSLESHLNENHPGLLSLDAELNSLRSAYSQQTNEQTNDQLVRLAQLSHQWVPADKPSH